MKHLKSNFVWLFLVCLTAFSFASCSDDNNGSDNPDEGLHKFLFINNLDESGYIGTFSDLSIGELNNREAYEHIFGIYPFAYKNIILVPEGKKGDKLHKYLRDSEGRISPAGSITLSQQSMPGEVSFVSETKAYVSLNGLGKIAVINPTTLEQTAIIDLTMYAVNDNNPDPGVSIIRDGKLYVALNQSITEYAYEPNAYVAIIDIATNTVEKVIKDTRVNATGAFRHSNAILDEKGDIYFYSSAIAGLSSDGFLRIKKGETEWDTDYLFSLVNTPVEGMENEMVGYGFTFCYESGGNVYSCLQLPSKTSNPPDFINDRNYQAVKLNLYDKTIEKVNLPLSTSMGAFAITLCENEVVYGLTTTAGTGYFTYNFSTGEASQTPRVTTVGVPSDIYYFK